MSRPEGPSPRTLGLLTLTLVLTSAVVGGFSESYVPSRLAAGNDAAATAANILASAVLYRLALVGYLVEAVCDVSIIVVLYVLTRAVNRELAMVALLVRFLGTALFAAAELFFAAPLLIAAVQTTVPQEQLDVLALLSLRIFSLGTSVANGFYGIGTTLFGALLARSAYGPRWIGALLALGGLGIAVATVARLVASSISPAGILIAGLAATVTSTLALATWLITRGNAPSQGTSAQRA